MHWIFGNQNIISNSKSSLLNINKYAFQTDKDDLITKHSNELIIVLDGYIIPRYAYYEELKQYSKSDLIAYLYQKHSLDFVNYIKGSFVIIIIDKEKVYVINDFHSFKKFYFYQKGDELLITNELSQINKLKKLTPDNENIAMFCLMEHFVGGYSLFQNVYYSSPATILQINSLSSDTSIRQYFHIEDLVLLKKKKITIREFSHFWANMINDYVEYLQAKNIGMTITGGNDSRMILSALLYKGINTNLFSFGNSKSYDVVVAKKIAQEIQYNYNNYEVSNPSCNWFSSFAEKILSQNNSLINIHRAHRLDAIEKELGQNPNTDILFGGFMGGDYVKGLIYDDYITPHFLWEYEFGKNKHNLDFLIPNSLKKLGIIINNIRISELKNRIASLTFINNSDFKTRKISTLFHLVGSMHDWQDTTIFNSKVKYVINPFMDIDFLEKLYSSNYSFIDVRRNFLYDKIRIDRSDFHIGITNYLAENLSGIEYAKRGHYNAKEYLKNNPILLTTKRLIRLKKDKEYPQNFPYGQWVKEYIVEQIKKAREEDSTSLFDWNKLLDSIKQEKKTSFTEKELHYYTNPINIYLNIEQYKNKNN